ncbi:MAG: hypothetical protein Q8Q09_10040 [Deltaproteobacteria bacterium]|nr:hypothetical protein [Deltaproteobacteria bacterium]
MTSANSWVVKALAALVSVGSVSACATMNPHRLEDTVNNFHEDLRWGRTDTAQRSVASSMRDDFARRHASWSGRVRIVDLDLEATRATDGRAYVRARYSWNFVNEIDMNETVIETRWLPGTTDWTCDEERVIAGDPRLLAAAATSPGAPVARAGGLASEAPF